MEEYTLYSKFDFNKHEKTFINYLEIIIKPDGEIEYAVPSHQEKLIKIACELKNITRQELIETCPPDYYFSCTRWLCNITGCISVHTKVYYAPNIITDNQKEIMNMLQNKCYAINPIV